MIDYSKDLYKAMSCKTPTKGSQFHIDDFADVWVMIPQINKFGAEGIYKHYQGRLVMSPQAIQQPGYVYLGEVLSGYHLSVGGVVGTINMDLRALQYYITTRVSSVVAKHRKKPRPLQKVC